MLAFDPAARWHNEYMRMCQMRGEWHMYSSMLYDFVKEWFRRKPTFVRGPATQKRDTSWTMVWNDSAAEWMPVQG